MNYTTWMSNPHVQSLKLSQLKIPGTHNSATFSLTDTLSQIKYGNIAFLWNLKGEVAPANGQLPWSGGQFYLGQPMHQFIMDIVKAVSATQGHSILGQLNGGIRYFDLRVYYDTDQKGYYLQHGLRACSFDTVLQQVKSYLSAHPTSAELIILKLSNTNFGSLGTPSASTLTKGVISLIQQYIGAHVYMPAGAANTNYDFQKLSGVTVGSITNGKSAVMILNTDSGYLYESTVINTRGFADSGRSLDGVDTVAALVAGEERPLQNNPPGTLYQVGWTLTPQVADIYSQIVNSLLNNGATPLLQRMALQANNALPEFIQNNAGRNFNLITVDWYEYGTPKTVVDICVSLNSAA